MTPIEDAPAVIAVIRRLVADHLATVNATDGTVTPVAEEEKSA
jgi:hypothetical protein